MSGVATNGFGQWKAAIQVGISTILNIGQFKLTRSKIVVILIDFSGLENTP